MWNKKNRLKYKLNSKESLYPKEYRAWRDMRYRCSNSNASSYHRYGGRGISVCKEWDDFYMFLDDMGRCPEKHSLDRIENNGNYTKENCRWADRKTQQRNTRRNKFITAFGKVLTLVQWAEEKMLPLGTLKSRILYSKMSVEEALTRPLRNIRSSRPLVKTLLFHSKEDGPIPS